MNKCLLLLFPVLLLWLSGCAASLVYDRRPTDCGEDSRQRCLQGSLEAVSVERVALSSGRFD